MTSEVDVVKKVGCGAGATAEKTDGSATSQEKGCTASISYPAPLHICMYAQPMDTGNNVCRLGGGQELGGGECRG